MRAPSRTTHCKLLKTAPFSTVVLLLCALCARAQQTTLVSGTLVAPNGSPDLLGGSVQVYLPKAGITTSCGTSGPVPQSVGTFPVTNGAVSFSLVPTDCLSQFVPYRVILRDRYQAIVSTTYWYVAQMATVPIDQLPIYMGAVLSNAKGNQWLHDAGLQPTPTGESNVFQISPYYPAGFQTASASIPLTMAPGDVENVTVTWPAPFPDANYTAVCNAPGGAPVQVSQVVSATRAGVTVAVTNVSPSGTYAGLVTCRGVEP